MAKRSLGYVFTHNNWEESEWSAIVEAIKRDCRYAIIGAEHAPSTGTPHIQGYIGFAEGAAKTFTAFKTWFEKLIPGKKLNFAEAARGTEVSNTVYCSKERDRIFEHGEPLATPADKGQMEKDRAKRNLEAIADGRWHDVDTDVMAHNLRNYEYGAARLKRMRRGEPEDLDGVLDNYWVYGPPGIGKDKWAKKKAPGAYTKSGGHKWWDGYDGQDDVILRDVGLDLSREIIDLFKSEWMDRYVFTGQTKGGFTPPMRPKRVFVTSNYHPDKVFGVDAEAMRRRFQIVYCHDGKATFLPRENIEEPPDLVDEYAPAPHPTHDPPSPDRFGLYLLD